MRKKPYQTPFLDSLVRDAWEILPVYSGEQQDLRVAVGLGEGLCMQRSAIIGRKALEVGVPAMRSIYFGWDTMPSSFRSTLFIDGAWVSVSTDEMQYGYYADRQYRRIIPGSVTWSRTTGGELHAFDEVTPTPASVVEIVIPENVMGLYKGAKTVSDYLDAAL